METNRYTISIDASPSDSMTDEDKRHLRIRLPHMAAQRRQIDSKIKELWHQSANRGLNSQISRDQHSVPRFWLNKFADGRKRAYLINVKNDIWPYKPMSTRQMSVNDRLYDLEICGVEISFEQMFAFWEDKASKLIFEVKGQAERDLRSGVMRYNQGVELFVNDPYRRWVLSYFFALSHLRSEWLLSKTIEEAAKMKKAKERELNVQVGDHLPKQVAFNVLYGDIERQDDQLHCQFGSPIIEKLAFWLFARRWLLFPGLGDLKFALPLSTIVNLGWGMQSATSISIPLTPSFMLLLPWAPTEMASTSQENHQLICNNLLNQAVDHGDGRLVIHPDHFPQWKKYIRKFREQKGISR